MGSPVTGGSPYLTAAAGIMNAIGSVSQGSSASAYYNAQASAVRRHAEVGQLAAERQIAYDTQAAADQIEAVRRQGKQDFGAQLAAMAAGGMSAMSGSARDIIASSARSEDRDVSNIQLQNARSAYEKRLQAQLNLYDAQGQAAQLEAAGSSARRAGYIGAAGSLLGTASQVYGMTYKPKAKTASGLEQNIKRYQQTYAPWGNFGGIY